MTERTPNAFDKSGRPKCGTCDHKWEKLGNPNAPDYYVAEMCTLCFLLRVRCWLCDWQYRAPLPICQRPPGWIGRG